MISQVLSSAISHNTFINHLVEPTGYLLKIFNLTKYSNETQYKSNLKVGVGMDWLQSLGLHLSV